MQHPIATRLKEVIREVPNFPKPGINFYDITTVLKDAPLFREVTDVLSNRYRSMAVDAIVGIEARGFIFGSTVAHNLHKPFIPIRKPGKLPAEVEQASYELEYGSDTLEIHKDALSAGHKAILIDDLIATGGTAKSAIELVERLGAEIIECAFVVELDGLGGRAKLEPTPTVSLLRCQA